MAIGKRAMTKRDKNDVIMEDICFQDPSAKSMNSSMSSVTMYTGSYYSGDSLSTIRTIEQQLPSGKYRMELDLSSKDDQPKVPGRYASQNSGFSNDHKAPVPHPGRFSSDSATRRASSDTIPVLPRRGGGNSSTHSSCSTRSEDSKNSDCSSHKTPRAPSPGTAQLFRDSLAAAIRSASRSKGSTIEKKSVLGKESRNDSPSSVVEDSSKPKANNPATMAMSPFRAFTRMTRGKSFPSLMKQPQARPPRTPTEVSSCEGVKPRTARRRRPSGSDPTPGRPRRGQPPPPPPSMEGSDHTNCTSPTMSSSSSYSSVSSEEDTPRRKDAGRGRVKRSPMKKGKLGRKKPPPIRSEQLDDGIRVTASASSSCSSASSSDSQPRVRAERRRISPQTTSIAPLAPPAKSKRDPKQQREKVRPGTGTGPHPRPKQQRGLSKQSSKGSIRRPRHQDSLTIILEDDCEEIY